MAQANQGASDEPVIVKKYANRRLYNTRSSSYITLEHLAQMTREGVDFKVIDAKSGNDITHNILTQIIMDEEQSGQQMLPVGFLRELIGMYGNSMQSLIPQYLEASMEAFRTNQEKFQKAMQGSFAKGPLTQLAEHNMKLMKAASEAFTPGLAGAPGTASETDAEQHDPADELAALKAQMAEMQDRLNKLGS